MSKWKHRRFLLEQVDVRRFNHEIQDHAYEQNALRLNTLGRFIVYFGPLQKTPKLAVMDSL